jgi:hypothetical protein
MKIQVGPHNFSVEFNEDAINRLSLDRQNDLIGHLERRSQTITIRPGLGVDLSAETLLHEVLHACFGMVGLSGIDERLTEEDVIERLSPILLDTLRRNPHLVRFLLAQKSGA